MRKQPQTFAFLSIHNQQLHCHFARHEYKALPFLHGRCFSDSPPMPADHLPQAPERHHKNAGNADSQFRPAPPAEMESAPSWIRTIPSLSHIARWNYPSFSQTVCALP